MKKRRWTVTKAGLCLAAWCLLLPLAVGCGAGGPTVTDVASHAVAASANPSPDPSPSPPAAPSPEVPSGIDPDKFLPAVTAYIDDLNAEKSGVGVLTVNASVSGIIGFVDISFTEMTAWLAFTEPEKKEYITALGKALDALAIENTYPNPIRRVGTDTTLFAPDGRPLAERNSLGIVKLY